MAFDNADFLAMYRLDSYFDLTSAQKKRFRPLLDDFIETQKRERLPEIVALLDRAESYMADGLKKEELDSLWLGYSTIRVALLSELVPIAAPFLADLSDGQWRHLEEELAESNDEWQELAAPKNEAAFEKKKKNRLDKQIDRFEEFLGPLTPHQEALIESLSVQDKSGFADYYAARTSAQKNFVTTLASESDDRAIASHLANWIVDPAAMYGKDAYAKITTRRLAWQTLIMELSETITPQQARRLSQSLADWRDFLAKQAAKR